METILEWLLVATAIPTTLFVLSYAARSRWWVTHYGRALLMQSAAVALLVDMTAVLHFYALHLTLNELFAVQAAAFGFAAISTTYLLIVLLIAQGQHHGKETP